MTSSAPEIATTQEVPSHHAPAPQQAPSTHAPNQVQSAPPPAGNTAPAPSIPQGTVAPSHAQQQEGPNIMSNSMSGSFEAQKDYSQSLDKLNSSLSELQGEIMKLSLSHSTTTTNSHTQSVQPHAPVPQQHQQQQHHPAVTSHPRPEPSGGEPDIVSARSSGVPAENTSQHSQQSIGTY